MTMVAVYKSMGLIWDLVWFGSLRSFTLEGGEDSILVDGTNEVAGAFQKGANNIV